MDDCEYILFNYTPKEKKIQIAEHLCGLFNKFNDECEDGKNNIVEIGLLIPSYNRFYTLTIEKETLLLVWDGFSHERFSHGYCTIYENKKLCSKYCIVEGQNILFQLKHFDYCVINHLEYYDGNIMMKDDA